MTNLLTPHKLVVRTAVAFVILLLVMLACSLVGSEAISLNRVFSAPADSFSTSPDYEIFVRVRVPRIVLAALVGAALASSGVVFQGLLRNPLADPYILGISSGAGLGVMIAVIQQFSWTIGGHSPVPVFAFIGSLATVWLVWFIGRLTGRFHITGLLLAGVVVNAFFSAVIMFLTAIVRSTQVHATIFWLMGNMTEESALVLWLAGGAVVTGIIALLLLGARLNAISLGEDDAANIGINVPRTRLLAFSIAAFMTAVAVSLSGLVGFVGLVAPHAVRLVAGPDHRQLIPLSAITGAAFLVVADSVARIIVAPAQLPVGVVTALIGGPFFLCLLIRHSRRIGWLT